jgi:hypothetical protein
MKLVAAVLALLACAGELCAAEDSACSVVASLVHADFSLPRVAAAIDKKSLTIAVVGSASSIVAGPAGMNAAYPIKLEAVLQSRLSGVDVKVVSYAKPRQTAAEMQKDLERVLMDDKPALVVWQTGTVDAIRGVDLEEFRSTLDEGVDTLQGGGADVVFMNMQYSPRTESMIAADNYADVMRWVALQREIPLFDRLAVMRQWNELGTFDLHAATRNTDMAEKVHACIGLLLADLVIDSARMTTTPAGAPP